MRDRFASAYLSPAQAFEAYVREADAAAAELELQDALARLRDLPPFDRPAEAPAAPEPAAPEAGPILVLLPQVTDTGYKTITIECSM